MGGYHFADPGVDDVISGLVLGEGVRSGAGLAMGGFEKTGKGSVHF